VALKKTQIVSEFLKKFMICVGPVSFLDTYIENFDFKGFDSEVFIKEFLEILEQVEEGLF